jgi:hypothetical protein
MMKRVQPSRVANGTCPSIVMCGICNSLLSNPVLCDNCDNCFCVDCIENYVKEHNGACQSCDVFAKREVKQNAAVIKMLVQLQILCSFEGCGAKVPYPELGSHEAACVYRLMPCPNQGCKERFSAENQMAHAKACEYAPVLCPHCKQEGIPKKVLPNHIRDCPQAPLVCEACKKSVSANLLQQHLQDCPEVEVQCQKCETRLPRRAVAAHDCISILREELKQLKSERTSHKRVILPSELKLGNSTFIVPSIIPTTARKLILYIKANGGRGEHEVRVFTRHPDGQIADKIGLCIGISSLMFYSTFVGQTVKLLLTHDRRVYVDGQIEYVSILGYLT